MVLQTLCQPVFVPVPGALCRALEAFRIGLGMVAFLGLRNGLWMGVTTTGLGVAGAGVGVGVGTGVGGLTGVVTGGGVVAGGFLGVDEPPPVLPDGGGTVGGAGGAGTWPP